MKRILLPLFLCAALAATPQSLNVDGDVSHWEADFLAGLNTDGWQIDLGAAYFPLQYIGIKANIGTAGEIQELGDWGKDESETGHQYATRFKFTPALVLRSPRLINLSDQHAGIYLFAEPGLILSPGASGSRGAKTCRWDFKAGINLQIDRFIVFAGYGVTNFRLYSGRPATRAGLPESLNYLTHSGFIGTAYKF